MLSVKIWTCVSVSA